MKTTTLILSAAAAVALAACDQQSSAPSGPVNVEPIAAPAGQSWDQMVTKTAEGGYMMGNPDAPVKLVEFGSMTCPHCAEFDKNVDELVDKYVKTGRVSFEFRNYVRDPFDLTASLIARCGGPERFFPLTNAVFESQEEWMGQLQKVPPEQIQSVLGAGQQQQHQFVKLAELSGLQQWAAQRGVPSGASTACLTNQSEIDQLVQMNADAGEQYNVPGTPAFVINNELVEGSSWETLEPKLREAIGG